MLKKIKTCNIALSTTNSLSIMFKFLTLFLSIAILTVNGAAQEKVNVKFGKISLTDFDVVALILFFSIRLSTLFINPNQL